MSVTWHKNRFGDDAAIPGQRMGGFVLLRKPAEFLPPDSQATLADWCGRCGVAVEVDEARGLVDVTTAEPRFKTLEGFGVGTEIRDIIAAWGPPDHEQGLEGEGLFDGTVSWRARGAGFAVKDGKALLLSVFAPDEPAEP